MALENITTKIIGLYEKLTNKEMWQSFIDSYFDTGSYYPNIGIDRRDSVFIAVLIIGLFVAFAISCFFVVYNKRVLGGLVRAIIKAEAFSNESAKTLDELGFSQKSVIWSAVKRSTSLRRVVKCREEEQHYDELEKKQAEYELARKNGEKPQKFKYTKYNIDPTSDRFYIPEDMRYMADIKFESRGSTWAGAWVCAGVIILLMVIFIIFLPNLLEFLNNLFATY